MKIVSIIGARPEFIQAMPLCKPLRSLGQEVLVHTGQHYDYLMSQKFFDELNIPAPDYNLEAGSGSNAGQTAQILSRLETVLLAERPDLVIIRGDTNSTLAGALAASKLHIPLAHVEAGERSFDRRMPEEINRLVADRISDLFFCASQTAVKNLAAEGIVENVHWVGDIMLDALRQSLPLARRSSTDLLKRLDLQPYKYCLVTVHRAANTDEPQRLEQIVRALNSVNERIIFPLHPRTRQALVKINARLADHIHTVDPLGYFDMLVMAENARLIATDSGGLQREAYYLRKPCLTFREATEWSETISAGWNRLVGVRVETIREAWLNFQPPTDHPPIYGTGQAAENIVTAIGNYLQAHKDK